MEMKNSEELRYLLEKIDHRGYPAYKETRGSYRFPGFILDIIHVQGDPFASPSRVAVRLFGREAGFPEEHIRVADTVKEAIRMADAFPAEGRRVILLENDLPDNY